MKLGCFFGGRFRACESGVGAFPPPFGVPPLGGGASAYSARVESPSAPPPKGGTPYKKCPPARYGQPWARLAGTEFAQRRRGRRGGVFDFFSAPSASLREVLFLGRVGFARAKAVSGHFPAFGVPPLGGEASAYSARVESPSAPPPKGGTPYKNARPHDTGNSGRGWRRRSSRRGAEGAEGECLIFSLRPLRLCARFFFLEGAVSRVRERCRGRVLRRRYKMSLRLSFGGAGVAWGHVSLCRVGAG